MKNKTTLVMIVVLSSWLGLAVGQQKDEGVVKLRGTKLAHPLVNKWISEFNKDYPDIKVSFAPKAPADSIDFSIASYALRGSDLGDNREGIVVSRYVQLPIASSKRPDLSKLQAKGFTEKNLNDLFFADNTPNLLPSSPTQTPIALYVRDRPVCTEKALASHFGNDPKELKGIGIKGDDQDLAEAVRNDANGLCFNNLGFIYDVKSRKITDGLAIIPLDLNENGKIDNEEKIYSTVDEVIDFIEKTHHPKFVNERVNFIFRKNSTNVSAGIFLNWVLTKGQKFHNELGFLSLDDQLLAEQKTIAATTFKTSSSSCEGANELMKKKKIETGK